MTTTTSERGLAALSRRIEADPTAFAKYVRGSPLTEDQANVARALRDHPMVLMESANVCGKTFLEATLALEWVSRGPDHRVIAMSSQWEQLIDTFGYELDKGYRACHERGFPLGPPPDRALKYGHLEIAKGQDVRLMSVRQGISAKGRHPKHMLAILDECDGIPEDIVEACYTLMANRDCRLLAGLNPRDRDKWPYRARTDPQWYRINISALRHPNVIEGKEIVPGAITREMVDRYRRRGGEEHPEWWTAILGEYPPVTSDQAISEWHLARAAINVPFTGDGVHIGVDLALATDRCAAAIVKDRELLEVTSKRTKSPSEICAWIVDLAKEHAITELGARVHVDSCGLGAAICAQLRDQGKEVHAVDTGKPCEDGGPWRHAIGRVRLRNVRALLFWVARRLIEDGDLRIPEDEKFRGLREEISAPTIRRDEAGKLLVQPKEEVRKRLSRSPDEGDAFLLALARRYALAEPGCHWVNA